MERFDRYGGHLESVENIEKDDVDWVYEKVGGKWEIVSLPTLGSFDSSVYDEKQRRIRNFMSMMEDMKAQWKLDDPDVPHNEGFLRDHPRYSELFKKWAMRYLRRKGFDKSQYSGQIDEDEGNLLRPDGRWSKTWLVNAVANNREWIDEYVEMELLISEGFVDITHEYEKREQLGIEPKNEGWWTMDEI